MTDQRTLAILVVDDDQECRDTYVDMCTRLGHSVTAVASGYQAEAQSAKESFDVVLCDYDFANLDPRNGVEVCTILRTMLPDARFFLCSGLTREVPPWITFVSKSDFIELRDMIKSIA